MIYKKEMELFDNGKFFDTNWYQTMKKLLIVRMYYLCFIIFFI